MKMKKLVMALVLNTPMLALEPLIAHIDIDPRYQVAGDQWTWKLIADGIDKDPALHYMPGRDLPAGTTGNRTGERHVRPASSAWGFLGVASGDPVWIYTQLNNQYAWLGFHDTQVSFPQPVRVYLHSVEGPSGGVFSLYTSSSAVLLKTIDGIDAQDCFDKPMNHSHMNWAFSRKGMWRVNLKVQGFLGAGMTSPTSLSPVVPLHFAIGHRSQWRAKNFEAVDVMNESISGDQADADGDGYSNLLEYAIGGNPRMISEASSERPGPLMPQQNLFFIGGDRYLQFEYYRRSSADSPEASYSVEWADSLHNHPWTTDGIVVSTTPVNAQWEKVIVRDRKKMSDSTKRFVRLRISSL